MANTQNSVFEKAYNSFSGVDIKAVVGQRVLSNLQAISTSITREKAPIYTMGSADPRSFSRGKRGIVGTLIFIVFDRHQLLDKEYGLGQAKAWLDKEELRPDGTDLYNLNPSYGEYAGIPVEDAETPLDYVGSDQEFSQVSYSDQLLPFDVVLTAANEYGKQMAMAIGGIEILNEGSGFSIDDIVTEQQMTYIARGVVPWTPMGKK